MEKTDDYKSGFITLLGRPNVGKSTLVNNLLGFKVAIVSDKPQTTRNKILAVLSLPDAQLLFIDTPGIHKPKHKLGQYMVRAAENTLRENDVVLFLIDVTQKMGPGDKYILERLKNVTTPVILVLNKIDQLEKHEILPIINQYSKMCDFSAVIPISALKQVNLDKLVEEVKALLKPGPQYYPQDIVTDQPERIIISELIREKVLCMTREEIPHSIAVDIEEIIKRSNEDVFVRATIYVERDSQKRIVIGAGGKLLKEIGQQSRIDIETLLGSKIFLDLWVKVKKDWRNRSALLKIFGYE